jgi:hypothetical protein
LRVQVEEHHLKAGGLGEHAHVDGARRFAGSAFAGQQRDRLHAFNPLCIIAFMHDCHHAFKHHLGVAAVMQSCMHRCTASGRIPENRTARQGAAPGPGVQCNAAGIEAASPDADLIRICDAHAALMDAVNNDPRDSDEDPNWPAYEQSFRAISATQPKTLEGMMAKARAAKAEARRPDGTEEHRGTTGEVWARDLVNDLLAIGGKVA